MENHYTFFDPLLKLEAEHNVWQTEINGVHLWSLVRFPLLRALYFDTLDYIHIPSESQHLVLVDPRRWRRYLHTLQFFQCRKPTQATLVSIVSNLSRYPTEDPNYSFDRLYYHLYDAVGDPLIVENSSLRYWAMPDKKYESRIISQDILVIGNLIKSRFQKLSTIHTREIKDYAFYVADLFSAPEKYEMLVSQIMSGLQKYSGIRNYVMQLAKRVTCRLALMEIGNYMTRPGLITKALHEAGFHVIEQQHGLIHRHHYAYNFPLAHTQSPDHIVHQYTPDTFLTFGDYWHQVSNVPGKSIAIGYPYLSQIAEKSQSQSTVIDGQILMISASANPVMLNIIQRLSQTFPQRHIVFKLHPRELHQLEIYKTQLAGLTNVSVVGQVDVYQLIAQSEVIASYDGSTVLIEASMFPAKRVFYHDANLIPPEVGERFEDADDLIDLIHDPERGLPQINPDTFYANDWQARLDQFFKEALRKT